MLQLSGETMPQLGLPVRDRRKLYIYYMLNKDGGDDQTVYSLAGGVFISSKTSGIKEENTPFLYPYLSLCLSYDLSNPLAKYQSIYQIDKKDNCCTLVLHQKERKEKKEN